MIQFITNAVDVAGKFSAMASNVEKIAPTVYTRWEEILDGAVLPVTPVRTGYLKSCIHAEYDKNGEVTGFWYGVHDADCDYAKYVEYAWGGRSAFFEAAVASVRAEMANAALEELVKAIVLQ